MVEFLSLFGFPVAPAQAGAVVLFALFFGIQAKLKNRPFVLAIQSTLAACIVGQFATTLFDVGFNLTNFFSNFLTLTFGAFLTLLTISWIVISLVFFLRLRNQNARIFTRNRNK